MAGPADSTLAQGQRATLRDEGEMSAWQLARESARVAA